MKNRWNLNSIALKVEQTESKGNTYTNPQPSQYLNYVHSHITRVVAATESCFTLIGAHHRGKTVGFMTRENHVSKTPYCRGECKAVYQAPAPHNTCGSCRLGTAQQFYHDMCGEGGSRVTSKLKQGAHIHQPMAITPRMCTAISRRQWQPWTGVSPLLGLISMAL